MGQWPVPHQCCVRLLLQHSGTRRCSQYTAPRLPRHLCQHARQQVRQSTVARNSRRLNVKLSETYGSSVSPASERGVQTVSQVSAVECTKNRCWSLGCFKISTLFTDIFTTLILFVLPSFFRKK